MYGVTSIARRGSLSIGYRFIRLWHPRTHGRLATAKRIPFRCHTDPVFCMGEGDNQTQMIETLLIVGIVGIVAAPLLLYRKTDNTKWLEFRDAAEECLTRYKGDDKKTVEMLVKRFGELCMQIAACTSYWDSKRGMLLAKEATRITMELQRRGFMEKSRKVSDEN